MPGTIRHGHRVLLVDDEPALLVVLRRVVQRVRPDAVVVYASDAETAQWQLRSTSIRLVVTDMRMNDDDAAGLRVVDAARSAGVPVAVLTGASSKELEELQRQGVTVLQKCAATAARLAQLVEEAFAAEA